MNQTILLNDAALYSVELPKSLGIETNELKSVLNETGVEYGDYSVSFALGCYHKCEYCYDCSCKVRFKRVKDFDTWGEPLVTKDFLLKLDEEIPKKKKDINSVMLSFAGDPFPYNPDNDHKKQYFHDLSFATLKKLNDAGIKCCVLTKGLLPLELADYAPSNSAKNNWYGISLVDLNHEKEYREQLEPNAAASKDRLVALKALKEKDSKCKTFVSMEPFPVPTMIEGLVEPIIYQVIVQTPSLATFDRPEIIKIVKSVLNKLFDKAIVEKMMNDISFVNAIDCLTKLNQDNASTKKNRNATLKKAISSALKSAIQDPIEAIMKTELEYVLSQLTWVDLVIFSRGNGINANKVNMFAKYKDHGDYYRRMAKVATAWGKANKVQVYVKRKVYGISKTDKDGNKLPKVELFV